MSSLVDPEKAKVGDLVALLMGASTIRKRSAAGNTYSDISDTLFVPCIVIDVSPPIGSEVKDRLVVQPYAALDGGTLCLLRSAFTKPSVIQIEALAT